MVNLNQTDSDSEKEKVKFFQTGHPRPLFPLFSSFQANITIFLQQI